MQSAIESEPHLASQNVDISEISPETIAQELRDRVERANPVGADAEVKEALKARKGRELFPEAAEQSPSTTVSVTTTKAVAGIGRPETISKELGVEPLDAPVVAVDDELSPVPLTSNLKQQHEAESSIPQHDTPDVNVPLTSLPVEPASKNDTVNASEETGFKSKRRRQEAVQTLAAIVVVDSESNDTQIAAATPKRRGRPRRDPEPAHSVSKITEETQKTLTVHTQESSPSPDRRRKVAQQPSPLSQATDSQRHRQITKAQSPQHGKCDCGFKGAIAEHLELLGPLNIKHKNVLQGLLTIVSGSADSFRHASCADLYGFLLAYGQGASEAAG
jgi:hypothetical protein